jgi:regulator of cell morphogenesis and NO signaling
MITSTMTVGEVAVQAPESTRLFESLKIDYCCGGKRPITEACESVGVEVDDVIAMLADLSSAGGKVEDTINFHELSLTALITHILETHHTFTKSEMDRLRALIDKVINAHGVNHPELFTVSELFQGLCADLKPHMFKEEQILFPYILGLDEASSQNRLRPFAPFGTVNNPIRMMEMEHETAGEILHELRAATSDYKVPTDGCFSYQTLFRGLEDFEKDLYQHIHLENNILFPKASKLEARIEQQNTQGQET